MKVLLLLTVGVGVAAAAWVRPEPGASAAPTGEYLEVRSATVFGGACHVNSELQSGGRQALLAWRFDAGVAAGVELAGVSLVAALSGDDNLGYDAPRRAVLYVSDSASAEQQLAATRWVRARCAPALGDIVAVEPVAIEFERAGDAFRLSSDVFEVTGVALADRTCCTMPDSRWYEPLDPTIAGSVVGNAARCRFAGAYGLPSWVHEDANNAHVARFGGAADEDACCGPPRCAGGVSE
jgi:hypothetical protein